MFLLVGLRDVFFTGQPLPFPDDDKMMKIWFSDVKTDPGHLLIAQACGISMATVAAAKLIMVHKPQEGQYLRKFLMQLFAGANLLMMWMVYEKAAGIRKKYGANVVPYVALLACETALFVQQAGKVRADKKGRAKAA